jgi:polar amino acid transport system substrate-binding protein
LTDNDAVELKGLVTATGISAEKKAEKFGFGYCTTDADALFEDDSIDAVFIATRHSTHADFTTKALRAGKHVFVEKPMVVSEDELEAVIDAYEHANEQRPTGLMVGLNRRFAPMVRSLRDTFATETPVQMIYRVNSGPIPTDSWLHRSEEGGGMLVGEIVHFVDLMQHICRSQPVKVYAQNVAVGSARLADHDNISLVITFADGSTGVLCYSTVGDDAASKERIEVYGGGCVAVLDDFRRLEVTAGGSTDTSKAWNQDKGQENEMDETVKAFRTAGAGPISFDELVVGMQTIFAARRSLAEGQPIGVPGYRLERVPS